MRWLNSALRSRLVTLAVPFFQSELRGRAIGGLVLVLVLLVAINGTNVVNSYVGRDLMSALAERHEGRFYLLAAAWAARRQPCGPARRGRRWHA